MSSPRRAPPDLEVNALRAAPSAGEWLRHVGGARVAHVFERAAYLVADTGDVLLLAAAPLGMGPFTLLVDAPPAPFLRAMDEGEPATVHDDRLEVGRLAIRFAAAEPWRATPDWPALLASAARWAKVVPDLAPVLRREARGSPFSGLLYGTADADPDSIAARLGQAARSGAGGLLRALAQADDDNMARGAEALAGLGGGFTPSGDDFLVGTMMALWALRDPESARGSAGTLAEAALPRTTLVSAAWLRAAAHGEATESWHRLFDALTAGASGAAAECAREILLTGHTSGEDALLGFILACEALTSGAPGP